MSPRTPADKGGCTTQLQIMGGSRIPAAATGKENKELKTLGGAGGIGGP